MLVYIPDATGITNFSLRTMTGGFVKNNYPGITSGWNHFRFFTEGAGNVDFTASVTTFRFIVSHAANTAKNIYIAGLLQIKPDMGNLIIVDDGPYQSFYNIAYPALKDINCPVTWAIDPLLLGDSTDPNRQNCSQAEIDALAYDGISEFSFHNYDGTIMSTATAQEALADTLNCIRYLRKNGIEPRHIFRASWLQNSCPNHDLADLEVEASATYNGSAGITMYPFPDKYNIARFSMQGRTTAAIDTIFDKLKNQHCTVFMYTHGISDDSDKNLTNALLQYYVSKIEAGISEGWLNATTYNRLISYYERL
jgi:peptidoglycan/xylan/chitin deacetylase (PgdA/CDA1 family)